MGNYTIFWTFENPRRGRQARNFTQNVPKILELKFTLGAPDDNLGSLPRRRSWGFVTPSCLVCMGGYFGENLVTWYKFWGKRDS